MFSRAFIDFLVKRIFPSFYWSQNFSKNFSTTVSSTHFFAPAAESPEQSGAILPDIQLVR